MLALFARDKEAVLPKEMTDVEKLARSVDEIDRKVIAHVREYGKVTNNTLKNLFDIDVYKARDIITDLAQRQILQRTSEAQRGPSVTWGPGTKFPTPRSKGKKVADEE